MTPGIRLRSRRICFDEVIGLALTRWTLWLVRRPSHGARQHAGVTDGCGGAARAAARRPARVRAVARRATPPPERTPVAPAEVDPVARVLVDVPLPHLDRPFDYAVPATMADDAPCPAPGSGCGSPARTSTASSSSGPRAPSTPAGSQPLRRGGQRRAGAHPRDRRRSRRRRRPVRRHAVRRAAAGRPAAPRDHREARPSSAATPSSTRPRRPGRCVGLPRAARPCSTALAAGAAAAGGVDGAARRGLGRRCWPKRSPRPRPRGRGALVVVPDHRDLDRLDAALTAPPRRRASTSCSRPTPGRPSATAAFLAVARGAGARRGRHPRRRVRAGARPRPGRDLGRRRRPARRAARAVPARPRGAAPARRSETGAPRCSAAHARSAEAEYLAPHRLGDARSPRAAGRACATRVAVSVAATATSSRATRGPRRARLPARCLRRAARGARRTGRCWCRSPRARLRRPAGLRPLPHAGPLRGLPRAARASRPATAPPSAAGAAPGAAAGPARVRRARAAGAGRSATRRTAEELGRAFPGVTVAQSSGGDQVLAERRRRAGLVVATPGAEPVAEGGYAAVLLLDTWLLLGRADLRAGEEALRRWANAAALVRPAPGGGRGGRRRRPGPPRRSRRWCAGTPAAARARELDERPGAPPARVAGGDGHRRRPTASSGAARARPARPAGRGAGPGAGRGPCRDRRRRRAGARAASSGCRARRGRRLCRRRCATSGASAPPASCRHLRVEVDPRVAGLTRAAA